MAKSLWELLVAAGEATLSKTEFGKKIHDPYISEEEKKKILDEMMDAGGYENLPDD